MARIKKKHIIMGTGIFILLSILHLLNGFYWRAKCNQTIELFGTAIINRDIDLLDTLVDWDCDMGTTEGKERRYHYQRGVIAEIWETKEYTITLYHYKFFGTPYDFWHNLRGSSGVCEFKINDINGAEYWLLIIWGIDRDKDGKIVRITASLEEEQTLKGEQIYSLDI